MRDIQKTKIHITTKTKIYMELPVGIEHHFSDKRIFKDDILWYNNLPPYNPLSMVLSPESSVVLKSGGYFIRQQGWKSHHFNRRIGKWTISVILRDTCLELFNAFYMQKKVVTLECKQVFERWDVSEIRSFLKKSWVNIATERTIEQRGALSNDATEKIKQLASDVLSGKR